MTTSDKRPTAFLRARQSVRLRGTTTAASEFDAKQRDAARQYGPDSAESRYWAACFVAVSRMAAREHHRRGFASCAGRPNQLPGRPCAICGCMEHA